MINEEEDVEQLEYLKECAEEDLFPVGDHHFPPETDETEFELHTAGPLQTSEKVKNLLFDTFNELILIFFRLDCFGHLLHDDIISLSGVFFCCKGKGKNFWSWLTILPPLVHFMHGKGKISCPPLAYL